MARLGQPSVDEHHVARGRERLTEVERVEAMRLSRALDAGVPLQAAELFAAGTGDLHRLERLVKAGCRPAVAADILT